MRLLDGVMGDASRMCRVVFALILGLATPLAAQKREGASLDLNAGLRYGSGGPRAYHDVYGVAVEATFAERGSAPLPGLTIGAVTIGASATPASGDVCIIDPVLNGCKPRFPQFVHIGLMGGTERFSAFGTLRLLAGPALYARSSGAGGVGALLHLDAATPSWSNVSLVLSARGAMLTRLGNETFWLRSVGVGFRLE